MARKFSEECLRELTKLMRSDDGTVPLQAKIAAINSILDRGLGKPMQPAAGNPSRRTLLSMSARTLNLQLHPEATAARNDQHGTSEKLLIFSSQRNSTCDQSQNRPRAWCDGHMYNIWAPRTMVDFAA